jgi:N-acyl homoserine lactone hydrolase
MYTVDHSDGRILIDTGTPDVARVEDVDLVVNTHLHWDHCGGNRLYAGLPIHVQRAALEADPDRHTRTELIHRPELTYVAHDGDVEILPGIRLIPTPGHCAGHQSVIIEGVGLIGGDVGHTFRELGQGDTDGRRLVLELGMLTWLSHADRPHVPRWTELESASVDHIPVMGR